MSYTATHAVRLKDAKTLGEKVKTWINARTAHLAVNDAKTHNLRLSYDSLGTSITAAQLAAIRAGTYDRIYPGDYWTLTVGGKKMKAVVLQLGGFRDKSVAVWLCTGTSAALNDTASTADGYIASKMHTEILPELLTQLQAAIGAENIAAITHTLSNQVTDGKISGVTNVTSSLELLSVAHIYGAAFSDIMLNAWAHNSVNPLAFFNLWRGQSWNTAYGCGEPWTCTPENGSRYYIAGPHSFYAEQPTGTNREVAPFFILA